MRAKDYIQELCDMNPEEWKGARNLTPNEWMEIMESYHLSLVGSDSFPCVSERFNDEKFIGNVCVSYRHDYGLMDGDNKYLLRSECKEWMRAIKNNASVCSARVND